MNITKTQASDLRLKIVKKWAITDYAQYTFRIYSTPGLKQRPQSLFFRQPSDKSGVVSRLGARCRARADEIGFYDDLLRRKASLDKLRARKLRECDVAIDQLVPRAIPVVEREHGHYRRASATRLPVASMPQGLPAVLREAVFANLAVAKKSTCRAE